jgi:hypothetical protein
LALFLHYYLVGDSLGEYYLHPGCYLIFLRHRRNHQLRHRRYIDYHRHHQQMLLMQKMNFLLEHHLDLELILHHRQQHRQRLALSLLIQLVLQHNHLMGLVRYNNQRLFQKIF